MNKYYEVILPMTKRPVYFATPKITDEYAPNTLVIVETSRGKELGRISNLPPIFAENSPTKIKISTSNPNKSKKNIILKLAKADDIKKAKQREIQAQEAQKLIKQRIELYNLDMSIQAVSINLEGTHIIINFYSPGRVDFRQLVKDLGSKLSMKIELYQIGPRDRAILLGDCGVCGRGLCCKNWLRDFSSVTSKVARSQGLSLTPNKSYGACGCLMCCLKFEREELDNNQNEQ